MDRNDCQITVTAKSGRSPRTVSIRRGDGMEFRERLHVDSARARQQFVRDATKKLGGEADEHEWLDDAIVKAADEADSRAAAAGDGPPADRLNHTTQLIELAADVELFHDANDVAYARLQVNDHWEVAKLRSARFRHWLRDRFYRAAGQSASSSAVEKALFALEGKALHDGDLRSVQVRVGEHEDKIYIDLANDSWQVVEITSCG